MSSSLGTASQAGPVYCSKHPRVETRVSCSSCGTPICPDCMVPAPVGIKCRRCARLPRSARVRLKPRLALRALGAAFAVGTGAGALLSVLGGGGLGFFSFLVAFGVGILVGRATLRGSGRYRSREVAAIAAAGAAWAYVLPAVVIALATGSAVAAGVQAIGLLIAAFFAYREAS